MKRFPQACLSLLPLAALLIMIYPMWLSRGSFLDGLIYSCIARNIAEGCGDFLHPVYLSACGDTFYSHPPLAFWLQSLLFRLLGDGFYTEKVYAMLTTLLTLGAIALVWHESGHSWRSAWMPCLLYPTIIAQFAVNNVLECTMVIFTTLSAFFYLRSLRQLRWLNLPLSGGMLALGVITKGFPALFPLVLPLTLRICRCGSQSWGRSFTDTLAMLTACVAPLALWLSLSPDAWLYAREYMRVQVLGTISGVEVVSNRFTIVWKLIEKSLVAILLVAVFLVISLRKRLCLASSRWRYALLWLGVTLCATLPIMVTLKQRSFYLIPAYAFMALALGETLCIAVRHWKPTRGQSRFIVGATALLSIAAMVMTGLQVGTDNRNREMLHDLDLLMPHVPQHCVINVAPALNAQYSLTGYCERFHHVCTDYSGQYSHEYLLQPIGAPLPDSLTDRYTPLPHPDAQIYALFRKHQ